MKKSVLTLAMTLGFLSFSLPHADKVSAKCIDYMKPHVNIGAGVYGNNGDALKVTTTSIPLTFSYMACGKASYFDIYRDGKLIKSNLVSTDLETHFVDNGLKSDTSHYYHIVVRDSNYRLLGDAGDLFVMTNKLNSSKITTINAEYHPNDKIFFLMWETNGVDHTVKEDGKVVVDKNGNGINDNYGYQSFDSNRSLFIQHFDFRTSHQFVLGERTFTFKLPVNPVVPVVSSTQAKQVKVAKGDTLYSVSKRFGTTVDKLKRANHLTNNTIQIGQILVNPSTVTVKYIVKKGDTLYGIAKKNNVSVDKIKKLNGLKSNSIKANQVLKLN